MSRLADWWRRLLQRGRIRADVDDEIRFHVQERVEALISQGVPPAVAAAQAEREFGDIEDVRRGLTTIDRRMAARRHWAAWKDILDQDVRYAVRTLTATPAFTCLVVATLALGIGANSAIFSLVDRLFFRPPAGVGDPSGLVRIYRRMEKPGPRSPAYIHYPGFQGVVTHAPPDLEITAYTSSRTPIGRGESPPPVHVAWVGPRYFSVLRVGAPALGRYPTDAEADVEQTAPLVVISHAQWMSRYGGDAAVIGSTIELSRTVYTIVGVAARGFAGVDVDAVDYWATLGSMRPGPWYRQTYDGVRVLIRGGTRSHGQIGDIATVGYRAAVPREASVVMLAAPLLEAQGPLPWSSEVAISTRLVGVALVVLLIACANVANLLLARTLKRRGEIAIRLAMGVSRARLVRLFLVESVVLSIAAGVASLVVAAWGGAAVRQLLMPEITWAGSILDARVLAFTLGVAIVTALLTGLLPALRASRASFATAFRAAGRDGSTSRWRGHTALLVLQVSLSLVLLVGAGAFVRSLLTVQSIPTGYETERLLFIELRYDDGRYRTDRTATLLRQLLPDLRAHTGVEDAALSGMRPLRGPVSIGLFRADGSEIPSAADMRPSYMAVSPRFFRTAGIDLLGGRDFGPEDTGGARPVMIVNQAMAQTLWPGRGALDQCVRIGKSTEPCVTVVGVVENTHRDGLIDRADGQAPLYFVPNAQSRGEFASPTLALVRSADAQRTRPLAGALLATLRRTLPADVYASVRPLTDSFQNELRPWVLGSTLFSAFGVLALVVASVGTYSALAYSVSHRTREMGIRLALGAPPVNLLRLVVTEGLLPVGIGLGAGLALALAAGRMIESMLYRTSPSDPVVLAVASLVLAVTAALGCVVPGLRATRVDPITVLRSE